MNNPLLLDFEQIHANTHDCEVLPHGLVLVTDKSTGDSFMVIPMNAPLHITKEEVAYVRDFYANNRSFTPEETALLQSIVVPPDQQLIDTNCEAVLKWYETVESAIGVISTKPTLEELKNPLFWNYCPVEVVLHSGEVCSYAVINQRAPTVGGMSDVRRILLRDVAKIQPSPFAVPRDILLQAPREGVEQHMGDGIYVAQADEKYCAIDMYYAFRTSALFFKNGTIKGSDLRVVENGDMRTFVTQTLLFSEPIECVIVDGLW